MPIQLSSIQIPYYVRLHNFPLSGLPHLSRHRDRPDAPIQNAGVAIRFSEPTGPSLIKLRDLCIRGFQGIGVEGSGFARGKMTTIHTVTIERINISYSKIDQDVLCR